MPNFASDILINVVRTKIPLISISLSSPVLIFVLFLVSSTIIQNVFVIFVFVLVVVEEKTLSTTTTHALVGSSKLEYLGDRAKVASLVVSQALGDSDINYIKRIRSNYGRVDVAVIDQITNDLQTQIGGHA